MNSSDEENYSEDKVNGQKQKVSQDTPKDINIVSDINLIRKGFKINHLTMKDGQDGKIMWVSSSINLDNDTGEEHLPKEILDCSSVTREINFTSEHAIKDLELIQNFYLCGQLIEDSNFHFGFVMPKSTNNWEQTIIARPPEEMMSHYVLSGNLVVETLFRTEGKILAQNRLTIFYD